MISSMILVMIRTQENIEKDNLVKNGCKAFSRGKEQGES